MYRESNSEANIFIQIGLSLERVQLNTCRPTILLIVIIHGMKKTNFCNTSNGWYNIVLGMLATGYSGKFMAQSREEIGS